MLSGFSTLLTFLFSSQGILAEESVGHGQLQAQAKIRMILSQMAPGFPCLRAPVGGIGVEIVVFPLHSGVSDILETGFQV